MSAVVQATCPGCKKTLRIPAQWMQQPIRCKYCGMVLNAKPPAAAAPEKSPASPPRAKAPAAPSKPKPAPPPRPVEAARPPVAPAPSYTPPEAFGSPFAELSEEDGPPRRRRRNRSVGTALVVCALLLLGGVGAAIFALSRGGNFAINPLGTTPGTGDAEKAEVVKDDSSSNGDHASETTHKSGPFPRRALLISVHNYLFANPVGAGLPTKGARNIAGLPDKLSNGLRIPRNQIAHLSDAAGNGQARPPLRPMIEETLTKFLASSRPQDCVMVFFVGHAVETETETFLVPLEGELDRPETLIPLKWVNEQLSKCPARQKVLVLDVCRLNPVAGTERPGGDAMGAKLAAAIQSPPAGVQIWSACGPEQHSYETEQDPMGVFLDELQTNLERASEGKLQLQDHIQKPDERLSLQRLKEAVDASIQKEVGPQKLAQTTLLTGKPADGGAAYDPAEPMPAVPVVAAAPPPLSPKKQSQITSLLADVAVPPVKPSMHDSGIDFSNLPPFDAKKLEPFLTDAGQPTDLRKTVHKTQVLLYAISGHATPAPLAEDVNELRKTLRGNLTTLRDGYRAPTNDTQFKNRIFNDEKDVARIMARLDEAHEDMKTAGEKRDAEPKRWQASYDFMLARLEAEIAYLYEYQSMLGQMRKEQPPRDKELHGGWKLAATTSLTGDSVGKKMAATSRKALDKLIKDNPGTPWEILARREKLTALGLEWKPVR
jgi:hypothetical protein